MTKHTELLLELVMILALAGSLVTSCAPPAETPTAAPPAEATAAPAEATAAPAEATAAPAEPTAAPTPVPPPEGPKRGGTLVWAVMAVPVKLDRIWSDSADDWIVTEQVVEGLTRASTQPVVEPGLEIEPCLAESWDISDDGLTYTFHLRPGVKFHNGKALTADDVVASLERARTMGISMWLLEPVTSMEAVDDSTVKITLNSRLASFLGRLNLPIHPREEIEAVGEEEFTKPIGTGPFMVDEWVRGEHVILDRNPYYWQMGEDGQPLPYVDQLVFNQVAEDTTRVLQVQAGSAHGTEDIPYSQIAALEEDPGGEVVVFPKSQIQYLLFRLDVPPFDDLKVRQALSLALDRQVFVDRVTAGKATAATSFFPNYTMCWDPNAELPYDLESAKELIAESSYPDGYTGAKLQVESGSVLGRDNAVIAQKMWDEIGIHVEIEEVEATVLVEHWIAEDFEAISGYQWTNGVMDPEEMVRFFIVDPRINSGWKGDERATELAIAAEEELDPVKRCEMFYEIQDIYNREVGGITTLYSTPSTSYINPALKGFYRTTLARIMFERVWLDE